MTAFTHPDRSLTRRIVAAASDATAVNGWLVRQLPLLFQRAGLIDVRARGFFPLETHLQSFYASMADRCAEAAVKAGVVTESEGRAWLHAFHDQGLKDLSSPAVCISSSGAGSRFHEAYWRMTDGYTPAKIAYRELRSAIGPWAKTNGYARWTGTQAGWQKPVEAQQQLLFKFEGSSFASPDTGHSYHGLIQLEPVGSKESTILRQSDFARCLVQAEPR